VRAALCTKLSRGARSCGAALSVPTYREGAELFARAVSVSDEEKEERKRRGRI